MISRRTRSNATIIRWLALAVALAAGGLNAPAWAGQGHYQDFGDAHGFLNIVPPGQDGVLNGTEAVQAQGGTYPPHVKDQLGMYGTLVFNVPGLTDDRLLEFYKDASFGVPDADIDRVYSPGGNTDVTVIRDKSFGVPHIFGNTRYATMFAQGYTGAEDRLFLMDVLRHLGRGRLSEFLGASDSNVAMDRGQVAIAPYKESDLTAQLVAIRNSGPEGIGGYNDLLAYADGVNQYINDATLDPTKMPAEYPALQQTPGAWKPEDAVAIASLVGGIFGKGGGGELTNLCGLKKMAVELGSLAAARAVFDDLHFPNDAEAPTTSHNPMPYMTNLGPVDPASHPDVDCTSLAPVDTGAPSLQSLLDAISGAAPPLVPHAISNALLVAASKTKSGHPIAVFGPQTGYFMPQLLVEKDVHGPDIDARGVAFAGTDLFVELGRGRDYAFSATSASADNVDQWVLKLCEQGGGTPTTSSMGYLHNGTCVPIEAFDETYISKPSGGGVPGGPGGVLVSFHIERTPDYGPLVARGKLMDGTPIAIATLRSTYLHELDSARGFLRINNPNFMTDGYNSFRQAMGAGVDYTFNWFYVDAKDIGYQHSCKCPQRAQGVDPYLPTWGTGQWDWQGFIPLSAQPSDLNPPAGFLTSWNNKQAAQFKSNDRQFSYGPVFRSQMLDVRIEAAIAAGPVSRVDIVNAMGDAMTVDLRGQEDLPFLLQVLGPTAPGGADPRAQEMHDRLATWLTTQTHRRDHDNDGMYDDPQAPAIIDAWWTRLAHAMFDAASGHAIGNLGLELDDGNRRGHVGSAFDDAFYSHVRKDLVRVLGLPQADPWSRAYCGNGDLAACRTVLWDAMSQAAADLQTEFGSASVADWKRQIADEDIRHVTVGLTSVPAIDWINRPTFQQVVQIPTTLDHFKCYAARRKLGTAPFARHTVSLADAFESKSTMVLRPDSICNAVDKNGEGVNDPTAHLACFRIKDAPGQPRFGPRPLVAENQFGARTVTAVRARTVCVPSTQNGAVAARDLDHFKCYQTTRTTPIFIRRTVSLVDPFEGKSTAVLLPQLLCNPAGQDGGRIADASAELQCYRIKDVGGQAKFTPHDAAVVTAFGSQTLTALKAVGLCVPTTTP